MYGEVLIPPAIFKELAVDSQKPGTATLKTALSEGKLRVVEVQPSKDKSPLGLLLDPGEVEAILLAEQMNCRFLLIATLNQAYSGKAIPELKMALNAFWEPDKIKK
jgi:predicted nucleic acid-binding protein